MQDLLDSCKRDPTTVRYFIKYEVLQKKPIWESYKNFCQTLGDDTMSYQEFEFWFWRFYNGELDMVRSADRKPLELLQLPLEMVGKVMQKLDLSDRMAIRYVSKVTRAIADSEKLKMKTISLCKSHKRLHLTFHENRFTYQETTGTLGFLKVFRPIWFVQTDKPNRAEKRVENENYVTYALDNLKAIMKNPKLELERFRIEVEKTDGEFMEKTLQILTEISVSSDFKFHVKEFCVTSDKPEHAVSFLSLLKPGILKEIDLHNCKYDREGFDAITSTSQWKEAKFVDLRTFRWLDPSEVAKCAHFEQFQVCVSSISSDIVVQLKEIFLQSISFKRCEILIPFNSVLSSINNISTALELPVRNQAIRVPIPGSDECLVFKISFRFIYIEKESINCLQAME